MGATPYNVVERIQEQLASQFKEATNLKGYIAALASEMQGLEDAAFQCLLLRSLDTATGFQLDILGLLVGQHREVVDASDLYYFGYSGTYHASAYGAARYALFGEVTGGVRRLEDVEYRDFIRARIARNNSRGTTNEVISLTQFLVGGSPTVLVIQLPDAKMQLAIGGTVDINKRLLLLESGLFPKPAGVGVSFVYHESPPFAYVGAPEAAAYGTGHYATTS